MSGPRLLVAGIGNIFLGDDAFGCEVAQRLMRRPQPPGVQVIDFGIRGVDLTYALLDGYDGAILIDASPRGQVPGTVYLLQPSIDADAQNTPAMDVHSMDPLKVLRTVVSMGGRLGQVLIVACEPSPMTCDDSMEMGMSPAVAGAVEHAVLFVEELIQRILKGEFIPVEVLPQEVQT